MLTETVAATSLLHEAEHQRRIEAAARRQQMKLIIVDRACRVIVDSFTAAEREAPWLLSGDRSALVDNAAAIVQPLVDRCLGGERQSQIAFLDAHQYVRVTQLDGRGESLFAVSLEFFRDGDSLSRAARKYHLTPREVDVLAMILEGASASETASALMIAETTVQGYFKRLLSKTRSRNRPAMVANVLDWQSPAPAAVPPLMEVTASR